MPFPASSLFRRALPSGALIPAAVLICALDGCTAIVLNDAYGTDPPCAGAEDCGAGFVCEDDVCVADDREPSAPAPSTRVGADGGDVDGPDGVLLSFPAGALDTETTIRIERASSTIVLDDLDARSRFYDIGPDLTLDVSATLSLPVEGTCSGCAVYREVDGAFVRLDTVAGPTDAVSGATASLGLFVVASEAP